MMTRRGMNAVRGGGVHFSRGAVVNVVVDLAVAISFVICAVSGLYFFLLPEAIHNTTWDLIHTWSGNAMIVAAVVHLWIHWRWVVKVTQRFFLSLLPEKRSPGQTPAPVAR
jgi:hypothetical protein